MGKLEDQLVDDLGLADGARERRDSGVWRHPRDETPRVELTQGRFAATTGQDRNVVDVGVFDHRGEGSLDVAGGELAAEVTLPDFTESSGVVGRVSHRRDQGCGVKIS